MDECPSGFGPSVMLVHSFNLEMKRVETAPGINTRDSQSHSLKSNSQMKDVPRDKYRVRINYTVHRIRLVHSHTDSAKAGNRRSHCSCLGRQVDCAKVIKKWQFCYDYLAKGAG